MVVRSKTRKLVEKMKVAQRSWKQAVVMMVEDLRLFGSLCIAELMVWRALRGGKQIGDRNAMMDLIFIGITVAFFLIAIGYVRVCEKLR